MNIPKKTLHFFFAIAIFLLFVYLVLINTMTFGEAPLYLLLALTNFIAAF